MIIMKDNVQVKLKKLQTENRKLKEVLAIALNKPYIQNFLEKVKTQ